MALEEALVSLSPVIKSLAEKKPYRFPDSLKLSEDHFIETKPRGVLPELPSLGVHQETKTLKNDNHLNDLMNKLRRPKL